MVFGQRHTALTGFPASCVHISENPAATKKKVLSVLSCTLKSGIIYKVILLKNRHNIAKCSIKQHKSGPFTSSEILKKI